jgi:putative heme iron utilization protein
MDADVRRGLIELLRTQTSAALATLHKGEPAISMVPVALAADGLLIHVSDLATHTRDMREHPRVSLLLMGEAGELPQARPRVSIAGEAVFIDKETPAYDAARAIYLARFAQAAMTFGLADFSLVRIAPLSARFVAGFAQAHALGGPATAELLREAALPQVTPRR